MITFVLYLCTITKLNKTHTFNKVISQPGEGADGVNTACWNTSSNYSRATEPYLQWWPDVRVCTPRVLLLSPRDCSHLPLLRLTAAELLRWRSPPQPRPSGRTQTGPEQKRRGRRSGRNSMSKVSRQHRHADGRYLGADQARPLVSDVLQRGSDVDLFNSCKHKTRYSWRCKWQKCA